MMPRTIQILLIAGWLLSCVVCAENDNQADAAYERDVRPVLKEFCFRCHGPEKQKAKLRLDTLGTNLVNGPEAETWHDVLNNLNIGKMPPEKAQMPSPEQRQKVVSWLTRQFVRAAATGRSTGGRVVMRRLTRYEYDNTMRDLLGIELDYAKDLPPEPASGDGFKNNGSTLGMSSMQIEYYLAAARAAMKKVIVVGPAPKVISATVTDSKEVTRHRNRKQKPFASKRLQGNAEFVVKLQEFPREGQFVVRVKAASAIPEGAGSPRLALSLGVRSDTITPERIAGELDVPGTPQLLPQPNTAQPKMELPTIDSGNEIKSDAEDRLSSILAKLTALPQSKKFNKLPQDEQKKIRDARKKLKNEQRSIVQKQVKEREKRLRNANLRKLVHPVDSPKVYEFRGQIEEYPLPGHNPKYPGLLLILRNVYDGKGDVVAGAQASSPAPKKKKGRAPKAPVFNPAIPAVLIESVEFNGPVYDSWPPGTHTRILFDSPDKDDETAYAEKVLQRFIVRAFRRPVTYSDVDGMMQFFTKIRPRMDSFEHAMRETLAMVLISPDFLYLVEPGNQEKAGMQLDDHELASRLSYFLWSTMPDDELFELASSGKLREGETLKQTVRRMITDPRSQQFVENFTTQWLHLDGLDRVAVNPEYYPDFDDRLKPMMRKETQMFFAEILRNDHNAMNLIDSEFIMLNRALGKHYGMDAPPGSEFIKVSLKPGDRRGGLLTQASILLSNSTGEDSHTIRRGVWLLDRLLGDPPAPPPPDVPEIDSEQPDFAKLPIRKQLEIHRKKESCNSCHRGIDPWGIPFENFDAVGLWRDEVLRVTGKGPGIKTPVDAQSILPGGNTVNGMEELKAHILKHEQHRFSKALVEKLLAYSLGRSLEWMDASTIEKLTARFQNGGHKLSNLIVDITLSEAFQSK